MNFRETIQLKALELKELNTQGATSDLREHMIEMAVKSDTAGLTRNICAHISVELFNRVEECCSMLSLSKRQFVEMALQEALASAETIVAEVDPFVEG